MKSAATKKKEEKDTYKILKHGGETEPTEAYETEAKAKQTYNSATRKAKRVLGSSKADGKEMEKGR
jgi:hypothetical protein